MKLTNTHFILGTILFVVIMISITTSCCDFMPYSHKRGSLAMSVYEGMKEEEEDDETKEGATGDKEEEDEEKKEEDEEKKEEDGEVEGFALGGGYGTNNVIGNTPKPQSLDACPNGKRRNVMGSCANNNVMELSSGSGTSSELSSGSGPSSELSFGGRRQRNKDGMTNQQASPSPLSLLAKTLGFSPFN